MLYLNNHCVSLSTRHCASLYGPLASLLLVKILSPSLKFAFSMPHLFWTASLCTIKLNLKGHLIIRSLFTHTFKYCTGHKSERIVNRKKNDEFSKEWLKLNSVTVISLKPKKVF